MLLSIFFKPLKKTFSLKQHVTLKKIIRYGHALTYQQSGLMINENNSKTAALII